MKRRKDHSKMAQSMEKSLMKQKSAQAKAPALRDSAEVLEELTQEIEGTLDLGKTAECDFFKGYIKGLQTAKNFIEGKE